jgi:hypothetical protein
MINLIDLARRFENEWIVLDRGHNVVDHGPELQTLQEKHEGDRRIFYFVSAMP